MLNVWLRCTRIMEVKKKTLYFKKIELNNFKTKLFYIICTHMSTFIFMSPLHHCFPLYL